MNKKKRRPRPIFGIHQEIVYTLCWLGRYGSGKSLGMTKLALDIAEIRKLQIVANYYIDSNAIRRYADAMGYGWLKHVKVTFEPDLVKLFSYQRAMVLMDEAGTKIFARSFAKIPGEFFRLYNQIRKNGSYFMFAAQSIEQIDYQVEQLIEFYLECQSLQKFDPTTNRAKLIERYIWGFDQGGWAKSRTGLRRYNFLKRYFDARTRRYQRALDFARTGNRISQFFAFCSFYFKYYIKSDYRIQIHKQNSLVQVKGDKYITRTLPLRPRQLKKLFYSRYRIHVEEDYIFKIYDSFRFADEAGKVYSRKHGLLTLEQYEQWLEHEKQRGNYRDVRQSDPNELTFSPEDFQHSNSDSNGNGKLPTLKRRTLIRIISQVAKEMKIYDQLPRLKQMTDDEIYKLYLELTLAGKPLK